MHYLQLTGFFCGHRSSRPRVPSLLSPHSSSLLGLTVRNTSSWSDSVKLLLFLSLDKATCMLQGSWSSSVIFPSIMSCKSPIKPIVGRPSSSSKLRNWPAVSHTKLSAMCMCSLWTPFPACYLPRLLLMHCHYSLLLKLCENMTNSWSLTTNFTQTCHAKLRRITPSVARVWQEST